MADYYTNRESRADRNRLPSNYIYTEEDSKGRRSVIPKPDSPSPAPEFSDEVRIVYDELMTLMLSKHKDYGPSNIANAPGGALNGLRVRMHDKLARINNLVDSNVNPEHESLEDSFKDMANYAIIGLLVLRGKWDK
jgi:hypothetical protein